MEAAGPRSSLGQRGFGSWCCTTAAGLRPGSPQHAEMPGSRPHLSAPGQGSDGIPPAVIVVRVRFKWLALHRPATQKHNKQYHADHKTTLSQRRLTRGQHEPDQWVAARRNLAVEGSHEPDASRPDRATGWLGPLFPATRSASASPLPMGGLFLGRGARPRGDVRLPRRQRRLAPRRPLAPPAQGDSDLCGP